MKEWSRALVVACLVLGCAAERERGELPGSSPPAPTPHGLEEHLYPAELVMDHQRALALDGEASDAIRAALQETQRELVDAEWELRREREVLAGLLAAERIDEDAALAAADAVAARESAIKRLHLRLLIRIKNQLTSEQRAVLDRARAR